MLKPSLNELSEVQVQRSLCSIDKMHAVGSNECACGMLFCDACFKKHTKNCENAQKSPAIDVQV